MQIPPNFPLRKAGHSQPSINARNLRLMVERNRLSAILTHFCGRTLIAFGVICGTSSLRQSMSAWVASLRSGDALRSVLHPGTLSGSVGPYESRLYAVQIICAKRLITRRFRDFNGSLAESNCSALSLMQPLAPGPRCPHQFMGRPVPN